MKLLSNLVESIREINRKYAQPEIHMTPFVRISLLVLRFYLIALIGLMIFKFLVTWKG